MKYDLEHYGQYLTECEKSKNTIEKYLRDVRTFLIFSGERELSKEEYFRLLEAAKENGNTRLYLLMQTLCATGIRVSELRSITVEAARCGEAVVSCKAKTRTVFLVKVLRQKLLRYAAEQGIESGIIFVTRTGKPINRTNIWREMKSLCQEAGVSSTTAVCSASRGV